MKIDHEFMQYQAFQQGIGLIKYVYYVLRCDTIQHLFRYDPYQTKPRQKTGVQCYLQTYG
jgi:hypothetical protein